MLNLNVTCRKKIFKNQLLNDCKLQSIEINFKKNL